MLSLLFILELVIAFSTAFFTISIPNAFFAFLDAFIPSVPTPQYKSRIVSLSVICLLIKLNSLEHISLFTWKKESYDTVNSW